MWLIILLGFAILVGVILFVLDNRRRSIQAHNKLVDIQRKTKQLQRTTPSNCNHCQKPLTLRQNIYNICGECGIRQ